MSDSDPGQVEKQDLAARYFHKGRQILPGS